MAYVVKKSDLFIGVDSFPAHLAGFFNRKMVSIYSNSFAACVRPYWGNRKNQKIIETERPNGEKPSFSFNENPKTVNRIKPEKIANSALEVMGIKEKVSYKTLFVGDICKQQCLEIVPTEKTDIVSKNIDVRMDIEHNEDILEHILQKNEVEVTTSNPISEKLLSSKRIKKVIYKSDKFDNNFIKLLKKYAIPNGLLCTSKKNLSSERAKLFDFLVNEATEEALIKQNKERFKDHDLNKLKIKSGKKTACGNKIYETFYDFRDRKNSDDFFLDLDWFIVYSDSDE